VTEWSSLEDRKPVHALVANVDLVVTRFDDKVSVLYGQCAHRGALMSDATVSGNNLICGLHGWDFGKISKEQKAGEWPVWQTSLHNPNFASYAKLCGGFGARVKTADDLEAAIQHALDFDGPGIVEIMSDTELI
jgi:hypothetical protein